MKIAVIIVRILMGLIFVFFSVIVLFKLMPQQQPPAGNVRTFMEGVNATGYLMTFIKVTELLCGIAFLVNRFAPLATVVIFPVVINIFLFHAFVEPSGVILAAVILLLNLFLAYAYRDHYRTLVAVK
jgi:putative oxidoreductase